MCLVLNSLLQLAAFVHDVALDDITCILLQWPSTLPSKPMCTLTACIVPKGPEGEGEGAKQSVGAKLESNPSLHSSTSACKADAVLYNKECQSIEWAHAAGA